MSVTASGALRVEPHAARPADPPGTATVPSEDAATRGAAALIEWLMLLGYAVASALAVSVALVVAVMLTSSLGA